VIERGARAARRAAFATAAQKKPITGTA